MSDGTKLQSALKELIHCLADVDDMGDDWEDTYCERCKRLADASEAFLQVVIDSLPSGRSRLSDLR